MPKQNEVDSMSYTTYNIGERFIKCTRLYFMILKMESVLFKNF